MILSSLMKLVGIEMTTKHEVIKRFMLRVEASSDYFTHKIAECTFSSIKNTSETLSTQKHLPLQKKLNLIIECSF
jgi:hypothetical protein